MGVGGQEAGVGGIEESETSDLGGKDKGPEESEIFLFLYAHCFSIMSTIS